MAAASAAAASTIKAALVATAAQPIVVNMAPAPSGWLQYTQVIGTLIIALIAAAIAGMIQWRQSQIAKGALQTAEKKLRLDLYDKRFAIFEAATDLIADRYIKSADDSVDGDYNRLIALIARVSYADWLLDPQIDRFLSVVVAEAHGRYKNREAQLQRLQQAWNQRGGYHVTEEMAAERAHKDEQLQELVGLFARYMTIQH